MLSKNTLSEYSVSLQKLFPNYTNQFLKPFQDIVSPNIQEGMHLDFEITDRRSKGKKSPLLRLARSEDAQEIVQIYKELYDGTYPYKEMEDEQEVRRMITSDTCDWVLFKDVYDTTLGCFTFLHDFTDKKGYIRGLMVRKEYQGRVDIVKAVIGSYIGIYSRHRDKILRWYCENRTAHAKSQFALSIGGIKPIAFYPNKDIFNGEVESDIMHIVYDKKAFLHRSKKLPRFLPEVTGCFEYSNKRYNLGSYYVIIPNVTIDTKKAQVLQEEVECHIEKDRFGYETITFRFKNSPSYFEFLYTPHIQNFEKTRYKVQNLEELYVFVQEFKKCINLLEVRYCEVFLSAYNPEHQKIFQDAGLMPRGYIPSWKYNSNTDEFEDSILYNWYEGQISEDIQLIDEAKELIYILDIEVPKRSELKEDNTKSSTLIRFLESKRTVIQKSVKLCLAGSLFGFLLLLGLNIGIAFFNGPIKYTIVFHTISKLGSYRCNPLPLLFDSTCMLAGLVNSPLYIILHKKFSSHINISESRLSIHLTRVGLYSGIFGGFSFMGVGIFSLERAGPYGIFHNSCAILAFSGFIISIWVWSTVILFFQKSIPKIMGIIGLCGPGASLFLSYILTIPLFEWLTLISILAFLVPLDLWSLSKL